MITPLYVAFGITFVVGLRMFLMSLGGGYSAARLRELAPDWPPAEDCSDDSNH